MSGSDTVSRLSTPSFVASGFVSTNPRVCSGLNGGSGTPALSPVSVRSMTARTGVFRSTLSRNCGLEPHVLCERSPPLVLARHVLSMCTTRGAGRRSISIGAEAKARITNAASSSGHDVKGTMMYEELGSSESEMDTSRSLLGSHSFTTSASLRSHLRLRWRSPEARSTTTPIESLRSSFDTCPPFVARESACITESTTSQAPLTESRNCGLVHQAGLILFLQAGGPPAEPSIHAPFTTSWCHSGGKIRQT
mmetsp:Transcript_7240/g.24048  ORF Transcript_7240/g.24048 Transcript_7240/m.24048 type:complete len:251 (-) Transcript_7240:442-1194(-)